MTYFKVRGQQGAVLTGLSPPLYFVERQGGMICAILVDDRMANEQRNNRLTAN